MTVRFDGATAKSILCGEGDGIGGALVRPATSTFSLLSGAASAIINRAWIDYRERVLRCR